GAAMCCTDDEIEWAQIVALCAELILARAVGNRRRKVSARQPHQCRLLLSPRPWCSPGFWPDAEGFRLQEGVLGSAGKAGLGARWISQLSIKKQAADLQVYEADLGK